MVRMIGAFPKNTFALLLCGGCVGAFGLTRLGVPAKSTCDYMYVHGLSGLPRGNV